MALTCAFSNKNTGTFCADSTTLRPTATGVEKVVFSMLAQQSYSLELVQYATKVFFLHLEVKNYFHNRCSTYDNEDFFLFSD